MEVTLHGPFLSAEKLRLPSWSRLYSSQQGDRERSERSFTRVSVSVLPRMLPVDLSRPVERGGPDEPNHDTNQLYHSFQLVLPEGLTCNSPGL